MVAYFLATWDGDLVVQQDDEVPEPPVLHKKERQATACDDQGQNTVEGNLQHVVGLVLADGAEAKGGLLTLLAVCAQGGLK